MKGCARKGRNNKSRNNCCNQTSSGICTTAYTKGQCQR
nr:MAG TPA: hypothetical protein [Caudoviricetes sp.]